MSRMKVPTIECKYCKKELSLTKFSAELLEKRGPYHATYLYRCECSADEVQVLPIERYPQIGRDF